jgi:hypothetical protein
MANPSERLTVLSQAEQFALYSLPDFDDGQQLAFLSLSEAELALVSSRPGLAAQVYCALQIGYFNAKHAFFRFDWDEVNADRTFVLTRYFNAQPFEPKAISKHEHYTQRALIAEFFGYQLWASSASRGSIWGDGIRGTKRKALRGASVENVRRFTE